MPLADTWLLVKESGHPFTHWAILMSMKRSSTRCASGVTLESHGTVCTQSTPCPQRRPSRCGPSQDAGDVSPGMSSLHHSASCRYKEHQKQAYKRKRFAQSCKCCRAWSVTDWPHCFSGYGTLWQKGLAKQNHPFPSQPGTSGRQEPEPTVLFKSLPPPPRLC